jgi:hypothetical protein
MKTELKGFAKLLQAAPREAQLPDVNLQKIPIVPTAQPSPPVPPLIMKIEFG